MPWILATSPSGILPSEAITSGVQLMDLAGLEAGMPSFRRFLRTVSIDKSSFLERAASEIVPSMAICLRVQLCRFPFFDGWGFMGNVAGAVLTEFTWINREAGWLEPWSPGVERIPDRGWRKWPPGPEKGNGEVSSRKMEPFGPLLSIRRHRPVGYFPAHTMIRPLLLLFAFTPLLPAASGADGGLTPEILASLR